MKKGFTLIETVMVISIIVILTALMQPVFSQAKQHVQVQSSVQRLKQLHLAVELYRNDHSLSGYSVDDYPTHGMIYASYLGLGKDFFKSPCGYKQGIEDNLKRLSYQYVPFPGSVTSEHYARYQDMALLFRDPHCNTKFQWDSPYMSKRKLGILTGGQIVNEIDTGSTLSLDWWLPLSIRKER